jgi:hypothetical protein
MNDVLLLKNMLLEGELPNGVSRNVAERRHAELNVDLSERMQAERPTDTDAAGQLAAARAELERLLS